METSSERSDSSVCFHNRFKQGIGRRCLLNGKLPVPLDER